MKSLSKVFKVPVRHSSNFRLGTSQEQKLETELGEVTFLFLPPSTMMPTGKEARGTRTRWHSKRLNGNKLQIGCARGMITIYYITAQLCYNKISPLKIKGL